MADDRQKDGAKTPPHPDDDAQRRKREDRSQPDQNKDKNDELEEGLEETFPASDPPAPPRPTGEK